jgi:hypothetical protein
MPRSTAAAPVTALGTSSASTPVVSSGIKKRARLPAQAARVPKMAADDNDDRRPLLDGAPTTVDEEDSTAAVAMSWTRRNEWIVFALASGACAAFNGVFAKL